MNAMLLHLDEELTNDRPGHSYRAKYSARDLALWVQFYSLFYDRILVPANFLTDLNLMPEMLQILRASDSKSLLQFEGGPLQILWDEQRFPEKDFSTLVGKIARRDTGLDASLRNISHSKETATICDKYLQHKVLRRAFSVDYYNDASVRLMRERVFSPSHNRALTPVEYERLSHFLEKIVERGGPIGYGRDFFYTLFGHCHTTEGRATARRFADIARELGDLEHLFLSSVDYASHTVKAVVAEAALREDVAALLPNQYQRVFRGSHTDRLWHEEEEDAAVAAKVEHRYLLDRNRIIGMTADQFVSIRLGDEYDTLRRALDAAGTSEQANYQDMSIGIATALDAYLKRIESVLSPGRYYADHLLEIAGRTRLSDVGLTILVAIGVAGKLALPEPVSGVFERGVELLTVHQGVAHGVEKVRDKTTRRKEFPTEGFQIGRDVQVKLLKN